MIVFLPVRITSISYAAAFLANAFVLSRYSGDSSIPGTLHAQAQIGFPSPSSGACISLKVYTTLLMIFLSRSI
ncbi:MAG: hypothetical protein IKD45_01440 [Clostridia bacterium]|nr:hypothetical protein [Clostridia bacterium]